MKKQKKVCDHSMAGKKTWPVGSSGEVEMLEQHCTECGLVERTRRFTEEFLKEMGK